MQRLDAIGPDQRVDARLEEYRQLSEFIRYIGERRDARMTLYFAVGGFLLLLLFNSQFSIPGQIRTYLAVGGLLVSVAFLGTETRMWSYWGHYRRRAVRLEASLGFDTYARLPPRRLLWSHHRINVVLYLAFVMFWLVLALTEAT